MTYAIIGAGNVGIALAGQFARANLPVAIANTRGPETIASRVADLAGVRPVSLDDALKADVIILALPFVAVETLGSRINWTGKIVIDATNAYGVSPEYLLAGRLSSDLVAQALPGASVVKAFNQLPAALLARETEQDGGKRVMFIAGDDSSANETVKALADQFGFSPIVLGRLDEGGRLLHIPGPLVLHNLIEHPLK